MRRRALFGGAAVLAAVAGLLAATRGGVAAREPRDAAPPPPDLWAMRLELLSGAPLAAGELRGKPLLLNFWATWCAPCVSEIPLLDTFARANAGRWNTLALAIDQRDAVQRFVAGRPFQLQLALAAGDGLELSHGLGNSRNALPFTAVFDSRGTLAERHLGMLDQALLERWRQNVA